MKRYQLALCFCFYTIILMAQPSWVSKTPDGYLNDFFVGRGIGITKTEATQKAYEDAVVAIMRNNSITVNYSENNKTVSEQSNLDDTTRLAIVRKSIQELRFEGESKTIKQLKLAETYYEQTVNEYEAWVLISFPKRNPVSPPSALAPVWRSLLIPGWGQLYKDQTFKGLSFMVLTIGCVASGLEFNQMGVDASKNAYASRTQARRDYFNNDKKNYNNYSVISFIAAGVFYTWSLVDAVIVKQDNLYVRLQTQTDYCAMNVVIGF